MSKLSKSSAAVLTWLYGAYLAEKRVVRVKELTMLMPEMSASGLRSLVFQLVKKSLVSSYEHNQDRILRITTHGIDEVTAQFPALSDRYATWHGQWTMLVFLHSPSFGNQFRYLRQFLLSRYCGQLSRGVYLAPSPLSQEIVGQLRHYPAMVAAVEISSWQFGDEQSIIGSLFSFTDLRSALSGVSNEIETLLALNASQKGVINQNTMPISLVFDRLLSILEFDAGIHHHYFSQEKSSKDILISLQQLF